MNLIYPLLNTTRDNYRELKYSIRSICAQYEVSNVILVGGLPDWFHGEHIQHIDYGPTRKEENIFHKIKAAGVDGMFCNDDHFLLNKLSLHHKGLMRETAKLRNPQSSYGRTLKNTLDCLGYDINDYDTHCPMMVTVEGLAKVKEDWPVWGYGFKTMYAYANGLQGIPYPDCKLQHIPDKIDREWFSTHDGVTGFEKVEKMFTEKSKFEK